MKILADYTGELVAEEVDSLYDAIMLNDVWFVTDEEGTRYSVKDRSFEVKWMSAEVFSDMWYEKSGNRKISVEGLINETGGF